MTALTPPPSTTAALPAPLKGLLGEFFTLPKPVKTLRDVNFDAPPKVEGMVRSINHLDTDKSFFRGAGTDLFAARYTGDLNVVKAGTYTIYLTSDDGSALYLDGKKIISNDGAHGTREIKVTLNLKAGAHDLEIRYFENTGKQSLKFEWQGPDSGGKRAVVSDTALSYTPVPVVAEPPPQADPAPAAPPAPEVVTLPEGKLGLDVSYFEIGKKITSLDQVDFNGTPAATGMVGALDYLRTTEAFWKGGPTDMFAARYTGELNVVKAGTYTIYLTSDDGSELYLDGKRVIDNDGTHDVTEKSVKLTLGAGAHDLEIRYFENTGKQSLKLEWKGPDSAGVRALVTGNSLTHAEPAETAAGGAGTPVPEAAVVRHPGLLVDYFTLAARVTSLSQIDFSAAAAAKGGVTQLNYLKTNDAFWQGGATDLFAARYTGDLNVVNAGRYTIYLTSDDGSELYLDGKKVILNDGAHGTREIKITLDLSAGAHDLEIRYFENLGAQSLKLEWQGPDSDGARKLISGTSLSHDGPIHAGDPGPCPEEGGAVCQCSCGTDDASHDHDTSIPTAPEHNHDQTTGGTTDPAQGATDGGTAMPGMGHDHGGETASLPLPRTAADADAYVAAVKALPETHSMHSDDAGMMAEHDKLLDLVPRGEATHVAIANGDWFDPATWYEGRIPGEGAKVLIPEGVSVTYDGESDASLFTVRVDGTLSFATDADTKMIVDTMVITASGHLEIGTAETPVEAGVSTQILIANNGDIDVGWDPMLLSRGIVSLGEVDINGAEKTAFLKVAEAPMKGDTVIDLAETPEGWHVGDTIVLTGTHKTGWTWIDGGKTYVESQDEEVVITAIEGGRITINKPLAYDHDTPREDLFAYVANTTRNVTIASEDGEATAVHQRGHVMFMHNDDVDVRYAAFDDLGRTDKSQPAFDIGALDTVTADSNIKGRYPLHFHKTGTTDLDDPAISQGNSISGSPGWAMVQHSSNANFIDNVTFDTFGASYVAEDGDETGIWLRNISIRTEGYGYGPQSVKAAEGGDNERLDAARSGNAFFFAGRLVEAAENVAANASFGFVWMTRMAQSDPLASSLDHPEITDGQETISLNRAPIQGFHDNEAFGTSLGLVVIKGNPIQGHDVRTVLDGFLNWETSQGVYLGYTAHYTLKDIDLVATDNGQPIARAGSGLLIDTNTIDVVVNGLTIEGFKTAVDLEQRLTKSLAEVNPNHVLIDVTLIDNKIDYTGFDPAQHKILTLADLVSGRLVFDMTGDTTLSQNERLDFNGVKTDSIGSVDRQFFDDHFVGADSIRKFLQTDGYYQTADGKKVMIIEDFVADRATGDLLKIGHVVTLDMSEDYLTKLGAVNKGAITLGGEAPAAVDDTARVEAGHDVLLDLLRNDSDPEGGVLRVDGFTDPRHGDVFQQDDGQLLYRPNDGFTGTDTFTYWAADDAGHFSKALVTIDVWDL